MNLIYPTLLLNVSPEYDNASGGYPDLAVIELTPSYAERLLQACCRAVRIELEEIAFEYFSYFDQQLWTYWEENEEGLTIPGEWHSVNGGFSDRVQIFPDGVRWVSYNDLGLMFYTNEIPVEMLAAAAAGELPISGYIRDDDLWDWWPGGEQP